MRIRDEQGQMIGADRINDAGAFAIGLDRVSKPLNAGTLYRVAAAFGADYSFTIGADYSTSSQPRHVPAHQDSGRQDLGHRDLGHRDRGATVGDRAMPFLEFPALDGFAAPEGFQLVGIEITDDAIDLPSFRHPLNAVYVLGPERGILQPRLLESCDFSIKIPTRFSLNVVMAGLTVLYDRRKSLRSGRATAAGAAARQSLARFVDKTAALRAAPPPAYED